jgi:hypothetical protein
MKDNKKNYQDLTIGIIMEILNNLIYLPQPQFEVAVLCQTFIGLLRICFVLICCIAYNTTSSILNFVEGTIYLNVIKGTQFIKKLFKKSHELTYM